MRTRIPGRRTEVSEAAYKRPESVLVVIHTEGEVLMLRRTRPAGFWQSVTGSLGKDEDVFATALRELAEETGLEPDPARLTDYAITRQFRILAAWAHRFPPGTRFNTEHQLSYRVDAPFEAVLNEHDDARWLSVDDAIALAASWTDRAALRHVFGLPREDEDG